MSYPPPLPPDTRENDTPMADNHAGDHNALVNAFEDVIGVIGGFPQGSYTGSMQDRLAWLEYQPGVHLKMTVPASPNKIILHCGTLDAMVVSSTNIVLAVPIAALTVTGAVTCGTLTSGAHTVNGALTATGRITGNDFVTTGPYYLNPSGTALVDDIGSGAVRVQGTSKVELRISGSGGGYVDLRAGSFYVVPSTSGVNWDQRALVVSGAALGAIGINSAQIGKAGAIQLYVSAVAGAGFHFVNGVNTGYLSCHAFKFVETSPPGLLRSGGEWAGDGLALTRQLRGHTMHAALEDGTEGRPVLGFLAAHVAEVLPDLVEDDDDGNPAGISYSGFIPVLADAIRRLDDRLAAAEVTIDAIRNLERPPT